MVLELTRCLSRWCDKEEIICTLGIQSIAGSLPPASFSLVLRKEAGRSSEMSVCFYWRIQHYTPDVVLFMSLIWGLPNPTVVVTLLYTWSLLHYKWTVNLYLKDLKIWYGPALSFTAQHSALQLNSVPTVCRPSRTNLNCCCPDALLLAAVIWFAICWFRSRFRCNLSCNSEIRLSMLLISSWRCDSASLCWQRRAFCCSLSLLRYWN